MLCNACQLSLPPEAFPVKQRIRSSGRCKQCRAVYMKVWNAVNKERVNARHRELWPAKYSRIGDSSRASKRLYYRRNREIVINHYGGVCSECQRLEITAFNDLRFLTLDHVNNDGSEHRKALGIKRGGQYSGQKVYKWIIANNFPPGFQVLCWNHNCAKV